MTPSESRQKMERMAADVDKEIKSKNPPQISLTPEQELLERCVKMEQAAAFKFKRMMKIRITPFTKQEFVEQFYKILRQEFNSLSKDEFATIACMLMATMAVAQVRDELI
jgi:hypothetical protein